MSLRAFPCADDRTPSDIAARILLRAHLDARNYRPCHDAAPLIAVPERIRSDVDLRAVAALAVAQGFGLLEPDRAEVTASLVQRALTGEAEGALDAAAPDAALSWCIAAAEWCERNGLDREFSRIDARAAHVDAQPGAPAWARVHWRVAAAWHHDAFGRRHDVNACLEQAQAIVEQASDISLRTVVQLIRARLLLARRSPAAALALAELAAANADEATSPLWLAHAADVASRAALVDGDMHRALQQSRRAAGLAALARATAAYTVTYRLNEAYALLGLGAWDEAVHLVAELALIRLPARLTERIELLGQLFALVRSDSLSQWRPHDTEVLARFVRRLRELDWPDVLPMLPGRVARLWGRALQSGIEPDWIRASIRSLNLSPPEPAWPRDWTWALRVHVIGAFSCATGSGESLTAAAGKTAARPLLLLRRVAAEGGYNGVSTDVIARDLWPGDGREGRDKALETTLGRLRRLLGHPDAILLHDRRLRLNPNRIWLDAAALARELKRLRNSNDTARDDLQAAWQEVFAIWRGPLLSGEPAQPWLDAQRQRLRHEFAATLLLHARDQEHHARCLMAMSVDPGLAELLQQPGQGLACGPRL